MRRYRVSISALLAGIAFFGVAFAAVVYPSPLAANAFYTLTVGMLLTGILGSVYSRGRSRAFWIGFSTFGWSYFLTVFGPQPISNTQANLVTEAILDILYPYAIPRTRPNAATIPPPAAPTPTVPLMTPKVSRLQFRPSGGARVILTGAFGAAVNLSDTPSTPWETWTTSDRLTQSDQTSPKMFLRIGHSIFCLLIAVIGGYLSRRFQETREGTDVGAVSGPPGSGRSSVTSRGAAPL